MANNFSFNPIRLFKTYTVTENSPFKIIVRKFWGWHCPYCDKSLKGNSDPHGTYWYQRNVLIRSSSKDRKEKKRMQYDLAHPDTTRKQAKDSYHRHLQKCPGVPGQG